MEVFTIPICGRAALLSGLPRRILVDSHPRRGLGLLPSFHPPPHHTSFSRRIVSGGRYGEVRVWSLESAICGGGGNDGCEGEDDTCAGRRLRLHDCSTTVGQVKLLRAQARITGAGRRLAVCRLRVNEALNSASQAGLRVRARQRFLAE